MKSALCLPILYLWVFLAINSVVEESSAFIECTTMDMDCVNRIVIRYPKQHGANPNTQQPRPRTDKICSNPPYASPGEWVTRNKSGDWLVLKKCPVHKITLAWRRGTRVKGNCGGSIARYTAIATFEGPYNLHVTVKLARQHAAIFVSCNATGITVFDQHRRSGGVQERVLRFGDSGSLSQQSRLDNGDLYYTIQ